MAEKKKTSADAKLIKKLFGVDPFDWARYPNDTLVFIAPDGSKHKYTISQLVVFSEPAESTNVEDSPVDADAVTYPEGQE
jgi:hypothetical protein